MTTKQYPIGGYAPGNYYNHCSTCGKEFQGDKMAVQCEPCAVKGKTKFDAMTDDEKSLHIEKAVEAMNKLFNNKQKDNE